MNDLWKFLYIGDRSSLDYSVPSGGWHQSLVLCSEEPLRIRYPGDGASTSSRSSNTH